MSRERDRELLNADERRALALTAELANLLPRIVGTNPLTRDGDLNEAVMLLHAVQRMIAAQAAARAYPEEYRLLGGTPLVPPQMLVAAPSDVLAPIAERRPSVVDQRSSGKGVPVIEEPGTLPDDG